MDTLIYFFTSHHGGRNEILELVDHPRKGGGDGVGQWDDSMCQTFQPRASHSALQLGSTLSVSESSS